MSDADWKWLLAHTEFNEVELQDMLSGNTVIYSKSGDVTDDADAVSRFPDRVPRRRHLQAPAGADDRQRRHEHCLQVHHRLSKAEPFLLLEDFPKDMTAV